MTKSRRKKRKKFTYTKWEKSLVLKSTTRDIIEGTAPSSELIRRVALGKEI